MMHEPDTDEPSLASALRALAEDDAARGVSSSVQTRLLAETGMIRRTRRRARVRICAIAAALVVAVSLPVWRLAERRPTTAAAPATVGRAAAANEFFPLTFSNVPVTGAQIVRLEVPSAALESFGLGPADSLDGSRPGMVLADVLVGEDGLARAVRFVRPGSTGAQQEQSQ
jgi:hypothetical protein